VTLREILTSAVSRLTAANTPSPRMNAELLLMFTLECDRAYLHAHPERDLNAAEQGRYEEALAERARGVPAQYITGHQEFWGMDLIVTPAVLITRANAARHQLESRVQFHETDLLQGFEPNAFDFVVSNPPYVGESEEDQVQIEVRKFEPRQAVFAGATGLEVSALLIPQARSVLKPGGWLVMEISGTIAEGVRGLLAGWNDVQITNDLQGIPRVISARVA